MVSLLRFLQVSQRVALLTCFAFPGLEGSSALSQTREEGVQAGKKSVRLFVAVVI